MLVSAKCTRILRYRRGCDHGSIGTAQTEGGSRGERWPAGMAGERGSGEGEGPGLRSEMMRVRVPCSFDMSRWRAGVVAPPL